MPFLSLISAAFPLVPLLVGLYFLDYQPKELRILILYFLLDLVFTVFMGILGSQKINNLWLLHIFTPIQFTILIWLFSCWHKPAVRKTLLLSIPAFIVFWLIAKLFFESFQHFNSYTRPIEALVLIAVSGYTLFQINKDESTSIYRKPSFWISSGILIYFTGMILLYAVSNTVLDISVETLRFLWVAIQPSVNITAHLLFAGGFLCLRPR